MESPGPFCKAAGIYIKEKQAISEQLEPCQLTNGLVVEIYQHTKKCRFTLAEFTALLEALNNNIKHLKQSTLISRVESVINKKKKLSSKKKVSGFKTTSELLSHQFDVCPTLNPKHGADACVSATSELSQKINTKEVDTVCSSSEANETCVDSSTQTESCDVNRLDTDYTKSWNLKKYLAHKQSRKLQKINNQIHEEQNKLDGISSRIGHYSVKNVNKRDETAKKNLHLLRDSQRLDRKNERVISLGKTTIKELQNRIQQLESQLSDRNDENGILTEKCELEKKRKLNVQKLNNKLRNRIETLKKENGYRDSDCEEIELHETYIASEKVKELKDVVIQKESVILELEQKIEDLSVLDNFQTKNEDGSYRDNIRMCVIQLAGLEVAAEKVTPVIEVVSEALFGKTFPKKQLPNKTTVQTIIDEGQFIAKAYIAERLDTCSHWGLNRDGTTRNKKKIIGTAVTLDNGEVASLGFTHVASETAKVITEVTQQHLTEMATIHSDNVGSETEEFTETFIVSSLAKLAFTMSDRAANEKLANKLLSEWRDDMLTRCGNDQEKSSVKHFHCMAHVLLGFHRYICDDLKKLDKELATEHGPQGRDALPQFKFWAKTGTVVERVIRTTSDTFGPAGDHLGLRDRWEAYCTEKGVKSSIGNYKDNRFNGLFQTAAEIIVHRQDFISVLSTVSAPNRKLQAVLADLTSDVITNLLLCLGMVFIKVTGPYWELITSGKVPYLKLHTYVQEMLRFLRRCTETPDTLWREEMDWMQREDCDIKLAIKDRFLTAVEQTNKDDQLCKTVTIHICTAMCKTVEKQLCDFLQEGQFSSNPTEKEQKQTEFASVTNLCVEHHFGDLDSSQKRRPNASVHHHTSVQLLKRNRKQINTWYGKLSYSNRMLLWKKARKGGKKLRSGYRQREKQVQQEVYQSMMAKENPKKRRRVVCRPDPLLDPDDSEPQVRLPDTESVKQNDYVVVAYQDGWYPGCVVEKKSSSFKISFMSPCRKPGMFAWPAREDIQEVNSEFILDTSMVPECVSSGRQWFFKEFEKYGELFSQYRSLFF